MLTLSLQRTVETQGWGEVGEGEDMGHDFFRKTKEKAGRWKEKAQQIRSVNKNKIKKQSCLNRLLVS